LPAEQRDTWVAAVARDWRSAALPAAERALCTFAAKLAREPSSMTEADVAAVRAAGFDDRAVHDATQVAAYFAYINRVADALGVEHESFVRAWEA
jgi:uncharacterized peroxidase-related enzyme